MKTTVIFHSADWDGEFCHQIAKKFLPPDTEFIGWDFKDPPLALNQECIEKADSIYILDLPVDRVFGFNFAEPLTVMAALSNLTGDDMPHKIKGLNDRIIWIDHHKSSIESHPSEIPGYRIDGVAACRLAWQWFSQNFDTFATPDGKPVSHPLALKEHFVDRMVSEPWAVRLAGEYDIWDKRDPDAELFQHGLRSEELFSTAWDDMLQTGGSGTVVRLLNQGRALQFARANEYRDVITQQGFTVRWDGITFLACNSHELDIRSHLFEAGIKPEHEALLGFTFNGKDWRVSMYHIPGKEHVDILSIAKKHGGGGHVGACGCRLDKILFLP